MSSSVEMMPDPHTNVKKEPLQAAKEHRFDNG